MRPRPGPPAFCWPDLVKENTLFRIWTAGQVSVPGFSEDYALLANALLDLYETDFDPVLGERGPAPDGAHG